MSWTDLGLSLTEQHLGLERTVAFPVSLWVGGRGELMEVRCGRMLTPNVLIRLMDSVSPAGVSSAIKPYLCASCFAVCFIVTVSALCGENLLKLLVHRCKEQLSWAPRGLLPHFLLNTWPRVFAEGDLAVCPSWLVSSPCPCEPPDTYHQLHLHSVFVSISSPHTLTVP